MTIKPTDIDWNTVWRDGVIFYAGRADSPRAWDGAAARMNETRFQGDYAQKLLYRIPANPAWTVIDVGCGPGTLAIPLAKTFKAVTALDISPAMLGYVRQNAANEGLHNIICVQKAFEEAVVGKDVVQHDVVIASRSMGYVQDLKSFLQNMDAAARRFAYLTWGTDERTFDIGVYKAIGRPYGDTRTYVAIYNLLYQIGIKANIEVYECQMEGTTHQTVEGALSALRKRFTDMNMGCELTADEEARLIPFLRRELAASAERERRIAFHDTGPTGIALIWWEKRGSRTLDAAEHPRSIS